ncbi:hypothetical protein CHA01nite_14470 [Chryseobacterium hagamense]|uniref:Uncharacterized protein n=1 Tax=Chryseobacterium hagamense TaxID=395935 RepID=A0A511YKI1_9FLAO|nr:hypothetical protein CHA01nite_14470 [Chryseobacterium hagamense]
MASRIEEAEKPETEENLEAEMLTMIISGKKEFNEGLYISALQSGIAGLPR